MAATDSNILKEKIQAEIKTDERLDFIPIDKTSTTNLYKLLYKLLNEGLMRLKPRDDSCEGKIPAKSQQTPAMIWLRQFISQPIAKGTRAATVCNMPKPLLDLNLDPKTKAAITTLIGEPLGIMRLLNLIRLHTLAKKLKGQGEFPNVSYNKINPEKKQQLQEAIKELRAAETDILKAYETEQSNPQDKSADADNKIKQKELENIHKRELSLNDEHIRALQAIQKATDEEADEREKELKQIEANITALKKQKDGMIAEMIREPKREILANTRYNNAKSKLEEAQKAIAKFDTDNTILEGLRDLIKIYAGGIIAKANKDGTKMGLLRFYKIQAELAECKYNNLSTEQEKKRTDCTTHYTKSICHSYTKSNDRTQTLCKWEPDDFVDSFISEIETKIINPEIAVIESDNSDLKMNTVNTRYEQFKRRIRKKITRKIAKEIMKQIRRKTMKRPPNANKEIKNRIHDIVKKIERVKSGNQDPLYSNKLPNINPQVKQEIDKLKKNVQYEKDGADLINNLLELTDDVFNEIKKQIDNDETNEVYKEAFKLCEKIRERRKSETQQSGEQQSGEQQFSEIPKDLTTYEQIKQYIVEVPSDGACLYHSILYLLSQKNITEYKHYTGDTDDKTFKQLTHDWKSNKEGSGPDYQKSGPNRKNMLDRVKLFKKKLGENSPQPNTNIEESFDQWKLNSMATEDDDKNPEGVFNWGTDMSLYVICSLLKINIISFNTLPDEPDKISNIVYFYTTNKDENRETFYILNHGNLHFSPLMFKKPQSQETQPEQAKYGVTGKTIFNVSTLEFIQP